MAKIRYALVMLESMAGTKHRIYRLRPRTGEKISVLHRDPWVQDTVLYTEKKRLRTVQYDKLPPKLKSVL